MAIVYNLSVPCIHVICYIKNWLKTTLTLEYNSNDILPRVLIDTQGPFADDIILHCICTKIDNIALVNKEIDKYTTVEL